MLLMPSRSQRDGLHSSNPLSALPRDGVAATVTFVAGQHES